MDSSKIDLSFFKERGVLGIACPFLFCGFILIRAFIMSTNVQIVVAIVDSEQIRHEGLLLYPFDSSPSSGFYEVRVGHFATVCSGFSTSVFVHTGYVVEIIAINVSVGD